MELESLVICSSPNHAYLNDLIDDAWEAVFHPGTVNALNFYVCACDVSSHPVALSVFSNVRRQERALPSAICSSVRWGLRSRSALSRSISFLCISGVLSPMTYSPVDGHSSLSLALLSFVQLLSKWTAPFPLKYP
jgi:hypothetical protein